MPRTTAGFEVETFNQLATDADKRRISLAERVRELVEIGLISVEQEKAHACRTSTLPDEPKGPFVGYVDIVKPEPVRTAGLELLWHVVVTEPGRETRTIENIEHLGLHPYWPHLHRKTRRSREITVSMSPSRTEMRGAVHLRFGRSSAARARL